MASQEAQEETKKESPHPTEYTPSGGLNPVVLNDSMQSKTAKPVQRGGNQDNSQTRPATQTVAANARTSDNFYNGGRGAKTSIGQQQPPQTAEKPTAPQTPQEKVLITGDDILIEYVERLMTAIRNITEEYLTDQWRVALEKFITHYVWHSQDRR